MFRFAVVLRSCYCLVRLSADAFPQLSKCNAAHQVHVLTNLEPSIVSPCVCSYGNRPSEGLQPRVDRWEKPRGSRRARSSSTRIRSSRAFVPPNCPPECQAHGVFHDCQDLTSFINGVKSSRQKQHAACSSTTSWSFHHVRASRYSAARGAEHGRPARAEPPPRRSPTRRGRL
jgi:hypothetical protein